MSSQVLFRLRRAAQSEALLQCTHIVADLPAHFFGLGLQPGAELPQFPPALPHFLHPLGTSFPCMSPSSSKLETVRHQCRFQLVFMGSSLVSSISRLSSLPDRLPCSSGPTPKTKHLYDLYTTVHNHTNLNLWYKFHTVYHFLWLFFYD